MASERSGLICAFVLDGKGGGAALDWDRVDAWQPSQGTLWVHLDRAEADARAWVAQRPEVEPAVAESLVNSLGNRPRVQRVRDAMLVMLRGVNQTEDADPEDMPTMHMWLSGSLLISLRRRRLMAGQEIKAMLERGDGPRDAGDFLVHMADRLIDPMAELFTELEEEVEGLSEAVLTEESRELRQSIRHFRHSATLLRRHLSPQREALSRLPMETVTWLSNLDRGYLREIGDRVTRYVEDLDSARERAAIAQEEELNTRIADQMNRTMYLLTVVAALLLPPSLLTGLFGINVGGMPGVESGTAFWIVFFAIPILAVVEYVVLKKMRWI